MCCPRLTRQLPAQLCGTMAKGLAAATLDGEYLARFRARPLTHRGRLMAGVQAAAVGVYEGVVGARHLSLNESAQCRTIYVTIWRPVLCTLHIHVWIMAAYMICCSALCTGGTAQIAAQPTLYEWHVQAWYASRWTAGMSAGMWAQQWAPT